MGGRSGEADVRELARRSSEVIGRSSLLVAELGVRYQHGGCMTAVAPRALQLTLGSGAAVDGFHPAVGEWFRRRFPEGPTPPQRDGWPHIAAGTDTLIAAPTGSGKTLAGFLVCIDRLYRAHEAGSRSAGSRASSTCRR